MSKLVRLSDMAYKELEELKKALGANDFDGVIRVLLTVYNAQQMVIKEKQGRMR